jgi:hypothetical protein
MSDIPLDSTTTVDGEIVLSERKVATEFRVIEIHENVIDRFVRADIELGPFTDEQGPGGVIVSRGSSRRGMDVWHGADYEAVALTWDNTTLIARIKELIELSL